MLRFSTCRSSLRITLAASLVGLALSAATGYFAPPAVLRHLLGYAAILGILGLAWHVTSYIRQWDPRHTREVFLRAFPSASAFVPIALLHRIWPYLDRGWTLVLAIDLILGIMGFMTLWQLVYEASLEQKKYFHE